MSVVRFFNTLSLFLCLQLCMLPGLSSADTSSEKQLKQQKVLVMGIFPRRNAKVTEKMFQPLADHLSRELGVTVVIEFSHDFATFWQRVEQQRYDIVHYNQYHYLLSHKLYGYNVIAQNEEFGHKTIAGSIIVRKDSGITSLQDLKGKKIVFGGGHRAMQAYISTTYLLRQAGLNKGDYFEQFALNPPKATIATFYRQSAAAGAGNYVLELPKVKKEIDTDEMIYLASSEPLAHLPWAIKSDMPDGQVKQIQHVLTSLHTHEEGRKILRQARLTKINPANDADYDRHREIVKTVLDEDL